ncbi:hypothetical protein D9757_002123 [Collybiopsis confluens]|uniref:Chitobiosyldiphosphodolichol beta-mannosyltransferase n=1 Tax=Collybiopsis confluens TaxID=2823264 RepID=A0A8H5I0N4_9AGAR|nr:hypothetical protein D9757_002123 [Collybiopsis confluens]
MTANTENQPVTVFHVVAGVASAWALYRIIALFRPKSRHSLRSAAILVLGDIGRSPRMMYHAQSFAENDFMTYVIGYGGSKPISALERLPKLQLRYLPEPPSVLKALPFVLFAPLKIMHQVASVLCELLISIDEPPEYLLVQNPPSIPTLALVWLVGRIRGCKVIIDWHNLGYSILALKLPKTHPFVRISKWFEATFGRTAYAHLFVTEAMKDHLVKEWGLVGEKIVLHDRPPKHFRRCSAQDIHDLFSRLTPTLPKHKSLTNFLPEFQLPYSTLMTDRTRPSEGATPTLNMDPVSVTAPIYENVQPPCLRRDRPALVVSSTSWTPDEDFGILLEALNQYERRAEDLAHSDDKKRLPKLLMVVTGKGPEREYYMNKITDLEKNWRWVRCLSLWLEAEDYPKFLGSADLGVCLHSSSSALDLPMKVVDMFGCGLPVCALNFQCLPELVKDGKNGLIFNSSDELAEQIESLLISFPSTQRLDALRSSLISTTRSTDDSQNGAHEWEWCSWDENWNRTLKPLLLR